MMTGEKDEKARSPLFPRLHVNDAEKGGPRAPPRNKMALYEQLSIPSQRTMLPFPSMNGGALWPQNHVNNSDISKLQCTNVGLNEESVTRRETSVLGNVSLVESAMSIRKIRGESCSRPLLGHDYRNLNGLQNSSKHSKNRERVLLRVGDVNKNDNISDTSTVDCVSAVHKIPDDVVAVMGEKQFLEARRVIANQQRAFSVQVFELHRLIKVQKLIAGSPQTVVAGDLYTDKPSLRPRNQKTKSNNDASKIKDEPSLGSLAPASATTDTGLSPWCYHPPPVNQWLIPIMSPSEGLIYKPYPAPFPPSPGFMSQEYGIPLSGNHHPGRFHFPPYIIPQMNTSTRSSAIAQVKPGDDPSPVRDINFIIPDKSSCNLLSHRNGMVSRYADTILPSKDHEVQVSTASSPCKKSQGEVLPLFPIQPQAQSRDCRQQTKVIKVVPHNPRAASKSAARIFRCIQEERRLID